MDWLKDKIIMHNHNTVYKALTKFVKKGGQIKVEEDLIKLIHKQKNDENKNYKTVIEFEWREI